MQKGVRQLRKKRLRNILNSSFCFDYGNLNPKINNIYQFRKFLEGLCAETYMAKFRRLLARRNILPQVGKLQNGLVDLKQNLSKIVNNTDYELERVNLRRESLIADMAANSEVARIKYNILGQKVENYSRFSKGIAQKSDYNLIMQIEDLERTIGTELHKFRIAKENILAIQNELDIIHTYESILRISSQSSERVYNKSDSAESQLRQIKMLYCSLGYKVLDAKFKNHLTQLSRTLKKIQVNYQAGLENIQKILADSDESPILVEEETDMERFFMKLRDSSLRKSAELETLLKFMVAGDNF
ncbi:MAG: hypothetical protein U9Q69_06325 [Nanoarchaeota archaeon]|nr:hypothetical protein [Nanoarchaeota archaeon]